MMKMITIGTTMNVEPAICRAKFPPYWPFNKLRPTDNVYKLSSFAIINGHRKLFHPAMNVKIPCTAMIGLEIGRINCMNTRNSLAPSRRAASSSSSGIVDINCLNKKILNAPTKPGRTTPAIVLVKPIWFKIK